MNVFFLVFVLFSVGDDFIVGIYGDGQRAHDIRIAYSSGKELNILHDNGGGLWLGDVSYNHRWFEMFNRSWKKAKLKDYGVLVCDALSLNCVRSSDLGDSSYSFVGFSDSDQSFQMCSKRRIDGGFLEKTLSLDSFQILFNSKSHRFVKP